MRVSLACALLIAGMATAVHAQDRSDRSLISYVDSVANAAVAQHRTPGVSVAIVRRGKTVLKYLGGGRFVGVESGAIQDEFPAEGSPAPSVVVRQGGRATTARRVP